MAPAPCATLVRAGAVPAALHALQHSSDDAMLEAAAGLLNNLQHNGGPADAATAATAAMEALPQLLRLVRHGSRHSRTAAARTLAHLARRPQYQQAVLPALVAAAPCGGIPGVLFIWRPHASNALAAAKFLLVILALPLAFLIRQRL